MVGINGLPFERLLFEELAGPAYMMTVYLVQHPVQEFFDAWQSLHMSRRLAVAEHRSDPVSMDAFFQAQPSQQRIDAALRVPLLEHELAGVAKHGACGQLLTNRLACRMGLDYTTPVSKKEAKAVALRFYVKITGHVVAPLLVERMEESLVLLRQLFCWRTNDLAFVNTKLWAQSRLTAEHKANTALIKAVRAMQIVDMSVYSYVQQSFRTRMASRPSFQVEVELMKQELERARASCATVDVYALMRRSDPPTTYAEKGCIIQATNESQYLPFFESQAPKSVQGNVPLKPCHGGLDLATCSDNRQRG